jgi:hypothetical protein
MATHHGNDGTVRIAASGAIGEIRQWSLTQTAQIADDSAMGDAWRTHLAGKDEASGQITCWWDEDDAQQEALQVGAEVVLRLLPEGNVMDDARFSATARVTEIVLTDAQDGIVERTFNYRVQGTVSESTVP